LGKRLVQHEHSEANPGIRKEPSEMNTEKLAAAAMTIGLAVSGSFVGLAGTAGAQPHAKSPMASTRPVPGWARTGSGCSISLIAQNTGSSATSRLSGQAFGGTALFDGGAIIYSGQAGLSTAL
jgi:hypothetical protein